MIRTVVCVGNWRNLNGAVVQVLARLGEIQETLKTHSCLIQSILRHLAAGNETTSLPEGIRLPMETMEEFDHVEIRAADDSFETALVG